MVLTGEAKREYQRKYMYDRYHGVPNAKQKMEAEMQALKEKVQELQAEIENGNLKGSGALEQLQKPKFLAPEDEPYLTTMNKAIPFVVFAGERRTGVLKDLALLGQYHAEHNEDFKRLNKKINSDLAKILDDVLYGDKEYIENFKNLQLRGHAAENRTKTPATGNDIIVDYTKYDDLSRFGRMYARVANTIYRGEFMEHLPKNEWRVVNDLFKECLDDEVRKYDGFLDLPNVHRHQIASVPMDMQMDMVKKFEAEDKPDMEALEAFRAHVREFAAATADLGAIMGAVMGKGKTKKKELKK